jgi:tetratricopeptide (TPR) repeat protein
MDILQEFEHLSRQGKWLEARTVAEEIVRRAPHIPTSWFNLAVCFEMLGEFHEAERCFRQAYEREPSDKGIQFRIFRCLAAAGDVRAFTRFAEAECQESPEVLQHLLAAEEFASMVTDKWFKFRFRGARDA